MQNQKSSNALQRLSLSDQIKNEKETVDYLADWSVKYAKQIATFNEMVEKDGLWSDQARLF